ncbi:TauD/TfdA dioxygenase family protein [Sphingomonas canadensis]|uniref:TauD/TfdA dioxygenase family protein n=1 Tax=Sphingomonas canadensis TaxID=1219257 RepID=A0ABW3HAP8_9SPHN|nr:TauD/TfdA family dioxygenase [Sphingomonas canadensis]MCW3838245.1 TauD/TfdA family dioxygenase [Sphingomonas canadensis]
MSLTVRPLHPIFGAEVIGADLTVAPDRELIEAIERTMATYAVAVVRDVNASDADHLRFSRAFGPLELPPGMDRFAGNKPRRIARELFDISNLDENGEIIPYNDEKRKYARATERFHTDSSFHTLPTKWSLLLAHIIPPEGGDTHFIDTRAVYDALPQATKERIDGLSAVHDFWRGRELLGATGVTDEMRAAMPPVTHPLVRTMPYGRKALYIGGHTAGIVGWPDDEALVFLEELYQFATQDRFIYVHKWRKGDLLIWDNRCTLHRATPLPTDQYKRDVRRSTVNEYGPEVSAAAAS